MGQTTGGIMQTNNRQDLVSDIISGILFAFIAAYIQLVLLGGALTLLVISKLFRNIGWVLVTFMIALLIYIYFKR
jgi:hypothetical protein